MKARFVVSRSTRWASWEGARHFLQPQIPDMEVDDADPVSVVLFESALESIPQQFEFANVVADKQNLGGLFGEEGIEIVEHNDPVILAVGDIVDIDISVIGRISYTAPSPEEE
jgi:hypothetical protein